MGGMKRSFLLLVSSAISVLLFATRHTREGRYYGGGRHTVSHGGSFLGGQGSSHKGGHYGNATTGNQYGRHNQMLIDEDSAGQME